MNDIRKKYGRYTVSLSHVEKIWFPQEEISKGEVLAYYEKVAPFFLAHVKNHLIVLHRFPQGIEEEGFYQKEISDYFPSWIGRKTIRLKKGGNQTLVLLKKMADLLYLANQSTIEFHSWLSHATKPNYPTKIIFDLDPAGKASLKIVRFAALQAKNLLEDVGLIPFLMTTGSRGYHVVAPLKPLHTFDRVRTFAQQKAEELVREFPKLFTLEMGKKERGNRVFIDYLRNGYGQTGIAPYSVRAREYAGVATPIEWEELEKIKPADYTIKNVLKRLSAQGDSWQDFEKQVRRLDL